MNTKELNDRLLATHVHGEENVRQLLHPPLPEREAYECLAALERLLSDVLNDFDALTAGSGRPMLGSVCMQLAQYVTSHIAGWWEQGKGDGYGE